MTEPYIPFYPADHLADTMHLTLEEQGAYTKLMFVMWRAGGYLEDDDKKTCLILGVTQKKWIQIKSSLKEFFVYENGKFFQKRLLAERRSAEEIRIKKSEAGRASAKAKSLNNKDTTPTPVENVLEQTPNKNSTTRAVLRTPEPILSEANASSSRSNHPQKSIILPDWLPAEPWQSFEEMRKKIKKPMTDRARELVMAKLDRFRAQGHDPTEILNHSVLNNYQDIYEPKEKIHGNPNNSANIQANRAGYGNGYHPPKPGNAAAAREATRSVLAEMGIPYE